MIMKIIPKRVLLFDVDGTLLDPKDSCPRFLKQAIKEVFGISISMDGFVVAGKTDWQILTEVMRMAGFSDEEINAKRSAEFAAYARIYALQGKDAGMAVLPGVDTLLDRLVGHPEFALGLVTGNIHDIVPYKLRAAGLDPSVFAFGAFGDDHIDRNRLPEIALERFVKIQGEPIDIGNVLVIGDTPRDIACARNYGLKVMCVATGQYSYPDLASQHPDFLLADLTDTDRVMAILSSF
jgi:phosphoglycolate phosphatase-like HAD superfamily hydrolase